MNNDEKQVKPAVAPSEEPTFDFPTLENALSLDSGAGHPTTRAPQTDFGTWDYVRLPNSGFTHFSLPDAALVAALDMWASGRVPELPDGVHTWQEDRDSPLVRQAIKPLENQLLVALVRSVESGNLDAEVLLRTLADSRPVPSSTFIELGQLIEWLEEYGHHRGNLIRTTPGSLRARSPCPGRHFGTLSPTPKAKRKAARSHLMLWKQSSRICRPRNCKLLILNSS
jgi:hypothetical protein